ncbi:MAG: mannose-6-phosphate isomerase, class I [Spirochaetales bacterium]
MYKLRPIMQAYPWGSPQWIPNLLGVPNRENKPWAELWFGAHPKASSKLEGSGETLIEWISTQPERTLGKVVLHRFGSQLPFLLKLLAAAEPLSIQCHPSKEQAIKGFQNEEEARIPIDAANRNYKDPNHKPEILVALLPFVALCGFRPVNEIKEHFYALQKLIPEISSFLQALEQGNLKTFYRFLLSIPRPKAMEWIQTLQLYMQRKGGLVKEEDRWFLELSKRYPEDIACFAPYYLNLVNLNSKQGLFLEAGILHAYLRGFGVELMANSDNVLRGGLTNKHVDLEELMQVARFEIYTPKVLDPLRTELPTLKGKAKEGKYLTPVEDFSLSYLELEQVTALSLPIEGPEIFLCTEGRVSLSESSVPPIPLLPGEGCFIDASTKKLSIEGSGLLFRARVNT